MTLNDLKNLKKLELLKLARELGIKGFSRLTKAELSSKIEKFINDNGKGFKEKVIELIKNVKINPPRKTRTTRVNPIVSEKSGKKHSKTQKTASNSGSKKGSSKTSTPSMKLLKITGIPEPVSGSLAPESEIGTDSKVRTKVESRRYKTDVTERGSDLVREDLRDVDDHLPELPLGYGDGTIQLMPRDPRWLFCYWDIAENTRIESGKNSGKLYLRLHDVTHIDFDGTNSWSIHQFLLNEEARFWYIPVPSEGRQFIAELGYALSNGQWNSMGFSDGVNPPASSVSPFIHDIFITLPFDKPLPLLKEENEIKWLEEEEVVANTQKTPVIPHFGTPTQPEPWSPLDGVVTSPGTAVFSSWVSIKDGNGEKEMFPLIIDGDLKILGATEPTAKLTIDGKDTMINNDGTFTLTLPIPDINVNHTLVAYGEKGEKFSITISIDKKSI